MRRLDADSHCSVHFRAIWAAAHKGAPLQNPLCQHRIGYLDEARDIRTFDEIPIATVFDRGILRIVVDIDHDLTQLGIDLFECPGESHAVLCHLKPRSRNPARITSFRRPEQDPVL